MDLSSFFAGYAPLPLVPITETQVYELQEQTRREKRRQRRRQRKQEKADAKARAQARAWETVEAVYEENMKILEDHAEELGWLEGLLEGAYTFDTQAVILGKRREEAFIELWCESKLYKLLRSEGGSIETLIDYTESGRARALGTGWRVGSPTPNDKSPTKRALFEAFWADFEREWADRAPAVLRV